MPLRLLKPSPEAVDFLQSLLCINPKERLSAGEALAHPFIKQFRAPLPPLSHHSHLQYLVSLKNIRLPCLMQSLTLTFLTHKFGTKDWLDQAKVFTSLADMSGTIGRAAILEALKLYKVGDSTDFSQIDYTSWLYLTTQTGWTEK